jgi:thiol-disulfide isomerase/thioredoxin
MQKAGEETTMKRTWRRVCGIALAGAWLSCGALAGEKSISGTVVDGKGQPQAGVEIAVGWNCAGKDFQLAPQQKIESDRSGQFTGKVPCGDGPVAIMAIDKARTRGALRVIAPDDLSKPVRLDLGPLVTASALLVLGDFEKKPGAIKIEVFAQPQKVKILEFDTEATTIKLKLPVGSYSLTAGAADAVAAGTEMDLDADEADFDCGKLKIEPKPGKGGTASKAAPAFKVTDAIGVDKNVKLSDYKGKWVVIDFWGYWCGPCVNIGLPALFKFAEEHKADSGKFVILTFHQPMSEKTLAACNGQFEKLKKNLWKIDEFPFPIVMDATGETVRNFKIQGYPTIVLIDPEGAVAETEVGAGRGICEKRLEAELKKSTSPAAVKDEKKP